MDLIIAHKATLLKAGLNYRGFLDNITQNSKYTHFLLIRETPHADRTLLLQEKCNLILSVSVVSEAWSPWYGYT